MRGSMKLCEAYSVGKASKNDVSKNSDHEPAKGNDEQIFINISSVKKKCMEHQSNQNDTGALC